MERPAFTKHSGTVNAATLYCGGERKGGHGSGLKFMNRC